MRPHDMIAFQPGPVTLWTTLLYLAIAIPLLHLEETVPPAPEQLPDGLNLTEAWQDLQNITGAFHPFNSRENDRVRRFFLHRAKEVLKRNEIEHTVESLRAASWHMISEHATVSDGHGEAGLGQAAGARGAAVLDDQTANFTMVYDAGAYLSGGGKGSTWTAQYFEGNNLYIYVRGKLDPGGSWWHSDGWYGSQSTSGGVLVSCHIDSVATSYGATDDGVACVSMLQLLSYFTTQGRQPDHGIVLLFNNAEEDGLLGSRAFGRSPFARFCSTFVNLEGVGAGGRAMLFRTTDGGVASAYAGSPHPLGSSIANAGFDRGAIMSGTDYEIFADIYGLRGLDIAFYKPRSRYHTAEDDARHTSVDSLWHMLSAALATVTNLSHNTSFIPATSRQGGKDADKGVWFDLLGNFWIVLPLRGLIWWSSALLMATPLGVALIVSILVRRGKCCIVTAGKEAWEAAFWRFPLALAVAACLTTAALWAVAKVNPLIVYGSSPAVWAMTLSSCYCGFWFVMQGSSPSSRLAVGLWLFALSWTLLVVSTALEPRLHIGSLYLVFFSYIAYSLSLVVVLLERLALPSKQTSSQALYSATDEPACDDGRSGLEAEDDWLNSDEGAVYEPVASVRTPLLRHRRGSRSSLSGLTSFSSIFQRAVAGAQSSGRTGMDELRHPHGHEDLSFGHFTTWAWLLQLFILAPVHIVLFGSQGLADVAAICMTGTDGSSLLTPLVAIGVLGFVLLLPLTPFMHRTTHHVPALLSAVFIGALIYSLSTFPFSASSRFRFIFQQTVDLDSRANTVTLSGAQEFLHYIVDSVPEAAGQPHNCQPTVERALSDCRYDASPYLPDVAHPAHLKDLIAVSMSKPTDQSTIRIQLDARETRTCCLDFSHPITDFTIEGAAKPDARLGQEPPDGRIQHVQLWRRRWEGAWNLSVQLAPDRHLAVHDEPPGDDQPPRRETDAAGRAERPEASAFPPAAHPPAPRALAVTVRCAWSDSNDPRTIPALHRLEQYMPPWAIATKRGFSLVEVKKRHQVAW